MKSFGFFDCLNDFESFDDCVGDAVQPTDGECDGGEWYNGHNHHKVTIAEFIVSTFEE